MLRDGVVVIRHDMLAESLRAGRGPPPHSFPVSFYTDNGKAAFEKFARRFGLESALCGRGAPENGGNSHMKGKAEYPASLGGAPQQAIR